MCEVALRSLERCAAEQKSLSNFGAARFCSSYESCNSSRTQCEDLRLSLVDSATSNARKAQISGSPTCIHICGFVASPGSSNRVTSSHTDRSRFITCKWFVRLRIPVHVCSVWALFSTIAAFWCCAFRSRNMQPYLSRCRVLAKRQKRYR